MADQRDCRDNSVRPVISNQNGIYKDLEQVVRKYAATRFLRPVADHTRAAFETARQFVDSFYGKEGIVQNVILDSGCGTGESTLHLARKFPDMPVIGVDKSAMRLAKAGNEKQLLLLNGEDGRTDRETAQTDKPENGGKTAGNEIPANAFWVRAELLDFWKLALEQVQAGRWQVPYHALFYPNPWPKESEATRRFHLHPIFPTLLALSPKTELRTNWETYAREFAEAARIVYAQSSCMPEIICEAFEPAEAETAFERKYKEAHQQLWRAFVIR